MDRIDEIFMLQQREMERQMFIAHQQRNIHQLSPNLFGIDMADTISGIASPNRSKLSKQDEIEIKRILSIKPPPFELEITEEQLLLLLPLGA
jgi:hypothetical protein